MTYYKFLSAGRIAAQSGYQWPEPGTWTPAVKGNLVACENGYHLCRPRDLAYWIDAELWEVEAKEIIESDNKIVARRARLVRRVDEWNERTQRLFACDCAERALETAGNSDPRSVDAVRVARLYAVGESSKEQLAAARAAAWAAAWVAARELQSERIMHYIGGEK